MNPQSGFAELERTRLYYQLAGTGAAVVLLHGFSLDTRVWDDQFALLAQHFRVLRYDLRGFGRSALPSESYSHVDDLWALLGYLGLGPVHLVGLSKGGGVALESALTHPQRTLSLTLVGSILGGFQWSPEGLAHDALVWRKAREEGLAAARESWLSHPLFAPALRQPAVAARLEQMVRDYSGWHFLNKNLERKLEPPAAARLAELAMPLLVLVGEQDTPDFLQMSQQIAEQVPRARYVRLAGVGHLANLEAPAALNHAVLDFLTGL